MRTFLFLFGLCVVSVAAANGPSLERDPSKYFVLAVRQAALKNLAVQVPACSIGVDCPLSGANCGVMRGSNLLVPAPGQATAASLCSPGALFTVFRTVGLCPHPGCSEIANPGPGPDCSNPLVGANALPILGDLDGNGAPSCGPGCAVDHGDIGAACGVTLPLPACNPAKSVFVQPNQDCGAFDTIPGNFHCDLAPGAYGNIVVRNGARLDFAPGTTVLCSLRAGEATRVTSNGPALVLVPGKGAVKLNNDADVGNVCGGLRIVAEAGTISFGRRGDFSLDACAIKGLMRLGHSNNLLGHFVADIVQSDVNSGGNCCTPPTTTSTTTTSTTSITSTTTTTTAGGSTTTTTAGGSTTTSTTTTTTASTTTTTTMPGGRFTRTPGFYKNHPDITLTILNGAAGLSVCGRTITNVNVDSASSALEMMCVAVQGDARLQLARQLMAAALSGAAGGAQFSELASCNAICADPNASATDIQNCSTDADTFNNSGDNVTAPFDPPGSANPTPCKAAQDTACTIEAPAVCATP